MARTGDSAKYPNRRSAQDNAGSRRAPKKKKSSLAPLFILLSVLGVVVVVLVLREPIQTTLAQLTQNKPQTENQPMVQQQPGSNVVIIGDTPDTTTSNKPPSAATQPQTTGTTTPGKPDTPVSQTTTITTTNRENTSAQGTAQTGTSTQPQQTKPQVPNTLSTTGNQAVPASQNAGEQPKRFTLWLSSITDEGEYRLVAAPRQIVFGDSPLSAALSELLKGPTAGELSQGLVQVFPKGTRLLSAWVRDGIAYLNFNEAFMFNPYGAAGLAAQVRQIVWIATEFPTVSSVRIIIEGKEVQYLGGDGLFVGKPLQRSDF